MNNLKNYEKAIFTLRDLYYSYGYLPYKMSKFEEYDLYLKNKEFLVSDRIITFTDTNGKLLALKPDVTLSILKNASGEKQKVYYNENVYRISSGTKSFKEIMQTGIENIGKVGLYDVYESVLLACKSLESISSEFVLDLSHLGIINNLLKNEDSAFVEKIIVALGEKNKKAIMLACEEFAKQDLQNLLLELANLYGDMCFVIQKLESLDLIKYATELKELCNLLKDSEYYNKIKIDFSLVGDINYYNGVIFKGYINGIAESVLSGGRYDKLAQKLGKTCSAIGFAVYLDLLENFNYTFSEYDVDTLIVYGDSVSGEQVLSAVNENLKFGSVRAQQEVGTLRYKKLIRLGEEKW